MRRLSLIGFLLLGAACSDSDDPNVSEAPHASELEEIQEFSESYRIEKADGLAIEVLVEGDGPIVRAGDLVTLHYRGTVIATAPDNAEEATEVEADDDAAVDDEADSTDDAEESDQDDSEIADTEDDSESVDSIAVASKSDDSEAVDGEAAEAEAPKVADTDAAEPNAGAEIETVEIKTAEIETAEDYVFGDTFKQGIPLRISMQRGSAIEGWRKSLVGLRVGARVTLLVSSELAYGEAGMPSARIPANADLRYEIELLETGVPNRRR